MKTLKSIVVALLIVGMMVMPAFGYVNHSGFSEGPMQTPADIEMIFGVDNLKGLEVAELSDQEMKDTQGLALPVVPIWVIVSAGLALAGGVQYQGETYYRTGKFGTFWGTARNAAYWGLGGKVGRGVGAVAARQGYPRVVSGYMGAKTGVVTGSFGVLERNINHSVGSNYNHTGSTHFEGNISVRIIE